MITPQEYSRMTDEVSPKSATKANILRAYAAGGGICAAAQVILAVMEAFGADKEAASAWTSIILVVAGAIATGFGWYGELARYGGAGTLVPITGFSNAVCSAAVEAQSEGLILGVGAKIFTIAGPVILYGTAASAIYGFICFLFNIV